MMDHAGQNAKKNLCIPSAPAAATIGMGHADSLGNLPGDAVDNPVDAGDRGYNQDVVADSELPVFPLIAGNFPHFRHLLLSRLWVWTHSPFLMSRVQTATVSPYLMISSPAG